MDNWISVEERLPVADSQCLGWDGRRVWVVALGINARHTIKRCQLTHWQPLPEPPKESDLSRAPDQVPCPHCGEWLPVQWMGWFQVMFFGSVICPYCSEQIAIWAQLVKGEQR